jgi:hypothetical protein
MNLDLYNNGIVTAMKQSQTVIPLQQWDSYVNKSQ